MLIDVYRLTMETRRRETTQTQRQHEDGTVLRAPYFKGAKRSLRSLEYNSNGASGKG